MLPILIALALLLASGMGALAFSRRPPIASAVGVLGTTLAAAVAIPAALIALGGRPEATWHLSGSLSGASLDLGLDPLSAFFLVPLFTLGAACSVYGRAYLGEGRGTGRSFFAYNLLLAGMAVVLLARDGLLFLVAWEVMSLSAWLLVAHDHAHPEARRAGWVYLIAAHAGTTALLMLFGLLRAASGGLGFAGFAAAAPFPPRLDWLLFLLALVGFGVKAGLVPLHVWLPEAHAAAPAHVSALMSGVMIKMGVYGLLRVLLLLGAPRSGWGTLLLGCGLLTALLGIALAVLDRDLKRALAYSSIENMGVIVLGLGLWLLGRTTGLPRVALLGLSGALLHVWNHALMKGLLFLAAGSLQHAAGTRDLERMGGLHRRLRWTGGLFLLGSVAIAALPPLNGFASEWLLYLGLLDAGLGLRPVAALGALGAAAGLALAGALAVLCFVRLSGTALLGAPRSAGAEAAHEAEPAMLAPMLLLAIGCLAIAVAPGRAAGLFAPLAAVLLPGAAAGSLPLAPPARLSLALLAALAGAGIALAAVVARRPRAAAPTWDCGYARPGGRMQYGAGSFAELAEHRLFPLLRRARRVVSPSGLLPAASEFRAPGADPITARVYEPFLARWSERFARLRWLQQGVLSTYLLYILAMLLIGLAWVTIRSRAFA